MSSPPPRRSVGHQLWLAGLAWQRAAKRALKPLGVTPTQLLILEAASRLQGDSNTGPSQQSIASDVGLDKVTVLRVARALEDRGLLERYPVGVFSWSVEITEKGTALCEAARPLMKAATKAFFARSDQRALRDGLASLAARSPGD